MVMAALTVMRLNQLIISPLKSPQAKHSSAVELLLNYAGIWKDFHDQTRSDWVLLSNTDEWHLIAI